MQNFDILWGGKRDHRESEYHTLNGSWTLLMEEISIFPTCSGVCYSDHIATFFIVASQTCIDFRAKFSRNYKGGVHRL